MRLLLNTRIALGAVAANDFLNDYDLERRCVDAASAVLAVEDADYTLDELNALKLTQKVGRRVPRHGGGKSIGEVMESFAEVVATQLLVAREPKYSLSRMSDLLIPERRETTNPTSGRLMTAPATSARAGGPAPGLAML